MSARNYNFDNNLDTVVRELNKIYGPYLGNDEEQFRTDISLLNLAIGTLLGMFGSYVVSNLPTIKDRIGRLNRRQIQQIERAFRSAVLTLDIVKERPQMIDEVTKLLPDSTERNQLAEQAVDTVLAHLRPINDDLQAR